MMRFGRPCRLTKAIQKREQPVITHTISAAKSMKGAVMAMQLRVFFFEKMNLKYPGLEKVEKCYLDGNLDGVRWSILNSDETSSEKRISSTHISARIWVTRSHGAALKLSISTPKITLNFYRR